MLRMTLRSRIALGFLAIVLFSAPVLADSLAIVQPEGAGLMTRLAARELRRYVYLRTGQLPSLLPSLPQDQPAIVVATKADSVWKSLLSTEAQEQVSGVGSQEYRIQTVEPRNRRIVCIVGGDDVGALYGAYRFCELLGVRFYLHGDVVPDA